MKYAFIQRRRHQWPVTAQCAALGGSARGFRQYVQRMRQPEGNAGSRRVGDMALLTHIKAIHAETKAAHGWPRV